MQGQLSICKGCGFAIRWFTTAGLKKMPVNPQPIRFFPSSGPETFVTKDGKVLRGKRDAKGSEVGYISHFATCPAADLLRKRGGGGNA